MSLYSSQVTSNFRVISEATKPAMRDLVRVLVADNDPITGRLLVSIGEKEGYQVVVVEDGREAYRMLKSDGGFNAAVFDMAMPHVEGVEIVRYMKSEKRLMQIPIVVVANAHGLKLIPECFAAGAMAFLPKPFSAEQLRRTVRLAMGSQLSKTANLGREGLRQAVRQAA